MTEHRPLSPGRIVDAAAAVADRGGVPAVSMRSVGRELGVEAMSLYHHVAGKEALLDALADWVFAQIEPPETGIPWREAISSHAGSAPNAHTGIESMGRVTRGCPESVVPTHDPCARHEKGAEASRDLRHPPAHGTSRRSRAWKNRHP